MSQLWDSPIFTKMTVNAIFKILKKKHIVHTTVYNVLYNYTDSFLDALHNVLPTLVPERNLGIIPLVKLVPTLFLYKLKFPILL